MLLGQLEPGAGPVREDGGDREARLEHGLAGSSRNPRQGLRGAPRQCSGNVAGLHRGLGEAPSARRSPLCSGRHLRRYAGRTRGFRLPGSGRPGPVLSDWHRGRPLRCVGSIRLRAALKIRRTAAPMITRSSSIWIDTRTARRIGPRRDVAETNRREDGDREVERPDVVEGLGERPRRPRGTSPGRWRRTRRGRRTITMPRASMARSSGSSATEIRRICQANTAPMSAMSRPSRTNASKARLMADRQDVEGPDDEHPGEHDRQAATHQGPSSSRRIEVGETDRPGSDANSRRLPAAVDPSLRGDLLAPLHKTLTRPVPGMGYAASGEARTARWW